MILLAEVLDSIGGAFPIFSYNEHALDEFLGRHPFDRGAFDHLSREVMGFLRDTSTLSERDRSICCEFQMRYLWGRIERAMERRAIRSTFS